MGLRLIYGRAGTGKSEYCFQEIKEKIKENKIYMITPEQFSFTAEKKLMNVIEDGAVINAEVITFNRMAYRVMNEVGMSARTNLSACGKAMLLYDILRKNQGKLKYLGKSEENIEILERSITEFKKHGIGIEQLRKEIEKTNDIYLKLKLQDLLCIYEKLEESMVHQYIDENDVLTILKEQVVKWKPMQNAIVYVDEFSGFTKQEYEILLEIMKKAKQVTVTIGIDQLEEVNYPESDVFYANKITADKLLYLARKEDISIEKSVKLDQNFRFQNKELEHLERNIYAMPYEKYEEPISNLQLFLANNPYTEVEHIAEEIVKLVRDQHYRYNEIAVITKNIQNYASLMKAIFNWYHIPAFIDEKKDLSQNIMVKYILSIFEIFHKNWSYESVFQYLKLGFFPIEEKELYEFEMYCIKWGIKGNKWLKEDWNFNTEKEEEKQKEQRWNELRKEIVNPLLTFYQKAKEDKTVESISKLLYEFCCDMKIEEKILEKIEKLEEMDMLEIAKEYQTSFQVVMQVLDEMVLVFGDTKISFEQYQSLLKVGLKHSGIGKIPGTQDEVIIGDVDRSRSHKVKAIFIIGLNDGIFPSIHKEEGFLNDQERAKLKEDGMELAKGTLEQLYDDSFNIYKAFTTAEQKLYLSYVSSDSEGKSLRSSTLISRIKKIFPKIQEKSDIMEASNEIVTQEATFQHMIQQLNGLAEGKVIDSKWFMIYSYYKENRKWKEKLNQTLRGLEYTNEPKRISKELAGRLYGNVLHTTVSRLEKYRSCPFSFFLKYGLKIEEKKTFKIQSIDTGSFMHDIIDTFFKQIREMRIKPREIEEEELKRIISKIIQEKLNLKRNYIFTSTPKFCVLTNRLKRVIIQAIQYMIEGLKYTDFEVIGNEIEFKKRI